MKRSIKKKNIETIEYWKKRCEQQEKEIKNLKLKIECVKHILSDNIEGGKESVVDFSCDFQPMQFAPSVTSSACKKSPILGSSSASVKRKLEFKFENDAQDLSEMNLEGGNSVVTMQLAPNPPSSLRKILTSTGNSASSSKSPILGSSAKSNGRGTRRICKSKSPLNHSQDPDETFWEGAEEKLYLTKVKEGNKVKHESTECDQSIIDKTKQGAKEIARKMLLETSYDRLPTAKKPAYAYKSKPLRGSKRKQLPGHSCSKCQEYYEAAGVSAGKCSKHRAEHPAVRSPKGYWDLDFPSTEELRARQAALPSP